MNKPHDYAAELANETPLSLGEACDLLKEVYGHGIPPHYAVPVIRALALHGRLGRPKSGAGCELRYGGDDVDRLADKVAERLSRRLTREPVRLDVTGTLRTRSEGYTNP